MTFQQWITVAAIVNAPLGIFLTWLLTERASERRAWREAAGAAETECRERVLEAAEVAETVAGDARSLAHGIYIKHTRREPVGYSEMMDDFNTARSRLDHLALRVRALGPSWAVEPIEDIQARAQESVQVLGKMEAQFTNESIRKIQDLLPPLDLAVHALVDRIASEYNHDSASLPTRPPHPDLIAKDEAAPGQ